MSLMKGGVLLDYKANIPIYLQVIQDIKNKILKSDIHPGDKLPSTRELAIMYKINPNTAARIYSEMEMMGICHTRRGLGTFVNEDEELLPRLRLETSGRLLSDFIEGMSALGYDKEAMIKAINDYAE